jgi:hypothetical protein
VVLGRNVWPATGPGPFLTALPADWSRLPTHLDDPEVRACRRAYVLYLIRNQWTLADAQEPARVEELLSLTPWPGGK